MKPHFDTKVLVLIGASIYGFFAIANMHYMANHAYSLRTGDYVYHGMGAIAFVMAFVALFRRGGGK